MYARKSINKYRHTLSGREARILSSLSYNGKTIFTTEDIAELIDNPKNVLDWLTRKKWILKIRKGVYAIAPFEAGELGATSFSLHSFVIGSVMVDPYYIGYWSALNYHGLTDQTPPAVYIAATAPKNSRRILNTLFKFVTIRPRKMFGIEEVEIEKRKIKISSREKTVVDCLDHPEHCGGVEEVAKALYFSKDEIDFKRLVEYAGRLGNTTIFKRLGFLAETLKLNGALRLVARTKLTSGYSLLDPTFPKRGRIRERWRLVLNVPVDVERWTR